MNSMTWLGLGLFVVAMAMILARSFLIDYYQHTTKGDWRWKARPSTEQGTKRMVWINVGIVLALAVAAVMLGVTGNV